jgi:hypothetical protein
MSRATLAAFLALPLLSSGTLAPSHLRKETARVSVTGPAGGKPQRFIVTVNGLTVLKTTPYLTQFEGTRVERDTLTTPAYLNVAGLGHLDLVAVDPTEQFTAKIAGLFGSATPTTTVAGSHFEISHGDFGKPFSIRVVAGTGR